MNNIRNSEKIKGKKEKYNIYLKINIALIIKEEIKRIYNKNYKSY